METKERKQTWGRKLLREISLLIPGYNIIYGIKEIRNTEHHNKDSIFKNNDGVLEGIYHIGAMAISNTLILAYLATSLGSGNWTTHQYREQERLESIAFGEHGLADYNNNGHVERWERVRFFDENGLKVDELLARATFRVNSRELEQAINVYKSRQKDYKKLNLE